MTRNITITPTMKSLRSALHATATGHGPDAKRLARIHAACFSMAWSATDIEGLLAISKTIVFEAEEGFALLRLIEDEAEILTIAVLPEMRRRGIGSALTQTMLDWLSHNNAKTVFLEVRQSNEAAITMYQNLEFLQISQRKNYYRNLDGSYESALVMQRVF